MTTESYKVAQRAIADLKGAVLQVLAQHPETGMSNTQLGHSLGIYGGYASGQEGHISRTLLGIMEGEKVVKQNETNKTWSIVKY